MRPCWSRKSQVLPLLELASPLLPDRPSGQEQPFLALPSLAQLLDLHLPWVVLEPA